MIYVKTLKGETNRKRVNNSDTATGRFKQHQKSTQIKSETKYCLMTSWKIAVTAYSLIMTGSLHLFFLAVVYHTKR
ncbi:hypothetical protein HXA34_20030 [Salipaludibacillus agaradhaerens]|nr:hypothetical protein [Salipaludibacillus agaradhaerens]MCR6120609.1 hypothetical protein [Salipaludibacillus agaradhaerens]